MESSIIISSHIKVHFKNPTQSFVSINCMKIPTQSDIFLVPGKNFKVKTRRSSFVTVFCVVKIVCLTCFSLYSESFDPITPTPLSHSLFTLEIYVYS